MEDAIRTPTSRRPERPPGRFAGGLAAVLAVVAVTGSGAAAQEAPPPGPAACPDGRITNVFIDNHSIFDVDDLEQGGPLRWAYELANALHVKTRASFIRRELLFDVGDCYDAFLLEESGRVLRTYGFIATADVFAVSQPDGSQHVVVDTQDEWTTKVDLGVSLDDGLQLDGLDVTEENLFGRGVLAAFFVRRRRERRDVGGRIDFPRLFGSRADAALSVGSTRSGRFVDQALGYPFVGELGRTAVRQRYLRRDEVFSYAIAPGSPFSHLLLPFVDERAEFSFARRFGRPGRLTLLGWGISRERLEFAGFPGDAEVARDGDFGATEAAPEELTRLVAPHTRGSATTRLNVMVGQRNLHFLRVRGLDALAGLQDVRLGVDAGLTVGRSVGIFGSSRLDGWDDVFTRFRLYMAHDPGTSFVFANLALEGRNVLSDPADDTGWKDVLGEVDVYAYLRSRRLPHQTLFARVSAAGGWSIRAPFQLSLGGRSAVRGFREEDDPGAQRLLVTLEDRIFLPGPLPDLFDLGITLFADAGRVWAGDSPFGVDSGWRGTVGFGLRTGFPAGSRGVARFDLAFPVGDDQGRGPIFRVTLYELLGLNAGLFDPQLRRSRRVNVGPDFFVQEVR